MTSCISYSIIRCSEYFSTHVIREDGKIDSMHTLLIELEDTIGRGLLGSGSYEPHRLESDRVRDVVDGADALEGTLSLPLGEVGWRQALQEALLLARDVRGVRGRVWHSGDIHHCARVKFTAPISHVDGRDRTYRTSRRSRCARLRRRGSGPVFLASTGHA